jgi:hypothetical protein
MGFAIGKAILVYMYVLKVLYRSGVQTYVVEVEL